MERKNCWEFMKCGREIGGTETQEKGVCPVVLAISADGIHGGKKGGRACWAIASEFCEKTMKEVLLDKFFTCNECDFHKLVEMEEDKYLTGVEIQKIMKEKGGDLII